jgi:hypothetical protein
MPPVPADGTVSTETLLDQAPPAATPCPVHGRHPQAMLIEAVTRMGAALST